MFDTCQKSRQSLNRAEYRDKVLGCWTGKNIGGTLGAPIEGRREMFDLTFYKQDLNGTPAPNDDLDLQLVWLQAAEERGVYQLNERVLGEYWMAHITGPWNEYGIGKANMANGFQPPLSGALNNGQWKNSNGAWIRSEIWECLFPGSPDDVLEFAWYDSCVDHAGDGIYAELFTAALESAAFVVQDIRRLIEIALSKIPADCRVARSVKLACREYDAGRSLADARNAIVAGGNQRSCILRVIREHRVIADSHEFDTQIPRGQPGRAEPEDNNMTRIPNQADRLLNRLLVEIGKRVVDCPGKIQSEIPFQLFETGRRFRNLPVQRTFRINQFHRDPVLQTGEAVVTELLAEPHHLRTVAVATLGELAHLRLKHLFRIVDDPFRYHPIISAQFREPLTDFQQKFRSGFHTLPQSF